MRVNAFALRAPFLTAQGLRAALGPIPAASRSARTSGGTFFAQLP